MDLKDPTTAALLAADAFEKANLRYAFYGGLLLAAYGEPRETGDVDLAVVDVATGQARDALAKGGLESEVSFEETRFGGLLVTRLMLLGGEATLGLNTVDLVRPRSARYGEAALGRSLRAPLREGSVQVLAPEDFVLFKLLSTRERDLEDAISVVRRGGPLDGSLIRREVDALAKEIPDFDLHARCRRLGA
ncbi:MAG: hypothetical protein ACT4PV_15600 [Planctomycetaceae bacterium]